MDNFNSGLYIPGDGLFDFAAASAKLLRPDGECSGRDEAALLRRSMAAIRRCHSLISRRYGAKSSVPAAFEWIMHFMPRACISFTRVRKSSIVPYAGFTSR